MTAVDKPIDDLLGALQERAKELDCLYRVEELLSRADQPLQDALAEVARVLPPAWRFPSVCQARVSVAGRQHTSGEWEETPWVQRADVVVEGEPEGEVEVAYTEERPEADEGPFIEEERRLLDTVAARIGQLVLAKRLHRAVRSYERAVRSITSEERHSWHVVLDFLRRTDAELLARLTRKMINHLC